MSRAVDRLRRALRPLGAIAGLTGAAAVVNRGLRERSGLPHDHLGGVRRPWRWRGYDVFATEAGSGPLVLLVHGLSPGGSSYEFRKLFGLLAGEFRVVAFDLLGCGLTEMPDIAYSTDVFVEQIVDALTVFGDEPAALVASSLGAAFAIRAAARANSRVARLIAICPMGLGGAADAPGNPRSAFASLVRTPVVGESIYNGLASRPALRRYLRTQAYADPAAVTDDVLRHYSAVMHQPGARFVAAHLLGGALVCDVARDLPFVDAPLLVLWGDRAPATNPVGRAGEYARLARHGELRTVAHAALLPHEEQPADVACEIGRFLRAPVAGTLTLASESPLP
ncbi:MAG: alpha/beta fold hydrolase [Vulcanimicrobiaceae bacterium]